MVDKVESLFQNEEGRGLYDTAISAVIAYNMSPMIKGGVLVGLSGGADSVMLLCFLLEYRRRKGIDFNIVAVHINHGIRGVEAERDENFCRELCSRLNVEFLTCRYDVPAMAKNAKTGIEETARKVRYLAFDSIISGRNDLSVIAVAHNRNDNAETVFFNILRGSGARGASGIRPIRDNIIRPLIRLKNEDIRSALDSVGISYVTDSTNLSNDYNRNYIRHEIMPKLNRIISDPEKMISRFADNIRSDDDFISSMAAKFLAERSEVTNKELRSLHYSLFVRVFSLMASAKSSSISASIASDVYNLLKKDNFSYSLIGRGRFICERGVCYVSCNYGQLADYCYAVEMGMTFLDRFNADLILSDINPQKTYSNVYKFSIQVNLSSAIISGSLYLRPKKDGDTIYYGGITHKLKKLFSDRKIPVSKRKLIPILCDDKGVVWVPYCGVRDDGIPKEKRRDLYAFIGLKSLDNDERLLLDTEYKT